MLKSMVKWCRDVINKLKQARIGVFMTSLQVKSSGFINVIQKRSDIWRFRCFKTNQRLPKWSDLEGGGNIFIAKFINLTGYLVSTPLWNQRSINAEWYTTKCAWQKVVVSHKRPNTGLHRLLLHHDNAQIEGLLEQHVDQSSGSSSL